jgi:hypothetical protein
MGRTEKLSEGIYFLKSHDIKGKLLCRYLGSGCKCLANGARQEETKGQINKVEGNWKPKIWQ